MPEKRFLNPSRATYKRPNNVYKPRLRLLIVCEGSKTEPNYFKKFPIPPESVIDVCGIGANTISLVREAIRLKSLKTYDQVWVVFDKDSFTNEQFNSACQLAESNHINKAYSNEAFELWYILHFCYLDTAITRNDYCSKLSGKNFLNHKYRKNSETIYDELLSRQGDAIRNSKTLLAKYDPPRPSLDKPSTNVHLLVELLNQKFWG